MILVTTIWDKALPPTGVKVWDFQKSDSDPIMVVSINPAYPISAATKGIEGYVTLEYTVGKDGSTRAIRIIDSNPPRIFDKSAINAVTKYKYQPAIRNGVAIESKENKIKLTFKMED
jgi:periplasmic protein TonB